MVGESVVRAAGEVRRQPVEQRPLRSGAGATHRRPRAEHQLEAPGESQAPHLGLGKAPLEHRPTQRRVWTESSASTPAGSEGTNSAA